MTLLLCSKNGGGGNGWDKMRQSALPTVNLISFCTFLDLLKINEWGFAQTFKGH